MEGVKTIGAVLGFAVATFLPFALLKLAGVPLGDHPMIWMPLWFAWVIGLVFALDRAT